MTLQSSLQLATMLTGMAVLGAQATSRTQSSLQVNIDSDYQNIVLLRLSKYIQQLGQAADLEKKRTSQQRLRAERREQRKRKRERERERERAEKREQRKRAEINQGIVPVCP